MGSKHTPNCQATVQLAQRGCSLTELHHQLVHGRHTAQLVLSSVGAQQNYGSVSSTMEISVGWLALLLRNWGVGGVSPGSNLGLEFGYPHRISQ